MSFSDEPLVRLAGVSKSYGSEARRVPVLSDVDLVLPRGQITSLLGRSGSGKSTLLSVIAGLTRPDRGAVWFDARPTALLDERAAARLRADRIGIVLQSDNLIPFLTAQENVELAAQLAPRPPKAGRARDLLVGLGLGDRLRHLPRQLSGGEAQRVAVAVALVNEPDLLLADEVVGQLDSATAADVLDLIFRASAERGVTVLYVTHDEELSRRATTRLRIADQQVVAA